MKILVIIGLLMSQLALGGGCLPLSGVVRDYATQQPLMAATLWLKTPAGKQKAGVSGSNGTFVIDVTCGATALVVECAGYRPQVIPLSGIDGPTAATRKKGGPATSTPVTFAVIPLIAVDRQGRDRPYLQTEQTHYEQQASTTPPTGKQRGTFVITDALTGQVVPAKTCLFFTKTQARNCYDTDAPGQVEITFSEPDIVALEVRSPGYQTYQGNLSVEKLDGQSLRHDIRLLRELTLLSVRINRPKAQILHCEARDEVTGKAIRLESAPGTDGLFGTYDLSPKRYILDIAYSDTTPYVNGSKVNSFHETITLQTGLNSKAVQLAEPPKPADTPSVSAPPPVSIVAPITGPSVAEAPAVSLPGLRLPETIPAIYFEQTSYNLRPDSEAVLQQVVQYMKTNPDYTLRVEGHTSNEGDRRLNQMLSENRAKATASFISRQGILDYRISISGQGDKTPLVPNDTDENKAKNRRVHLTLAISK